MVISSKQGHILFPLQEQIVKKLGEKGPITIYRMKDILDKDYKTVWKAFQSLKQKGLVCRYNESGIWLTERGIILALCLGCNPHLVKEHANSLSSKLSNLKFIEMLCDLITAFEPNQRRQLWKLAALLEKATPENAALTFLMSARRSNLFSEKHSRKLLTILKDKYPSTFKKLKAQIRKALKDFDLV